MSRALLIILAVITALGWLAHETDSTWLWWLTWAVAWLGLSGWFASAFFRICGRG